MKKGKGFKVGDKVFAKVKGYPAWPAIVTEDKNNKYSVRFYGTGEIGIVKPKDLFYYLKHKDSFVKSHKRKDYNEAIEEIEKAIQESGTDGNDGDTETQVNSSAATDTSDNNSAKSVKRKRSASLSVEKVNNTQVKRRAQSRSGTPHLSDQEKIRDEEENGNLETENDENAYNIEKEEKTKNNNVKEQTVINTNSKSKTAKKDLEIIHDKEEKRRDEDEGIDGKGVPKYNISDIYVINMDILQGLIAYAEYVRQKEEIYKKMPVEDRKKNKIELLIVKQPDGKLVGIKFNYEMPPFLNNEYEYAQYEETKAKRILSVKTLLEQGSSETEEEPNMFVTNLNFDMDDVTNALELDLITRKREKLLWLKTEANLVELDSKIKGSLGLDRADPKQAIVHLDKILQSHIEPLILKKHPPVVDMVKRLCRYIGNVKEWNFTDDEREEFEIDAARVRNKAADVYLKFASIFDVQDETKFWDIFSDHVESFKQLIKDMSESYVYALSAEPYSRKAFFDAMDEAEELKMIDLKMEKSSKNNKTQQDNPNKTANTENNKEQANVVENSNSVP